jgi:hypothetical protein
VISTTDKMLVFFFFFLIRSEIASYTRGSHKVGNDGKFISKLVYSVVL